jgi:hypothetical protein
LVRPAVPCQQSIRNSRPDVTGKGERVVRIAGFDFQQFGQLFLGKRFCAQPVNRLKIILLCITAAITYGVLHDQVTARLCIEYFTVAHPPYFSATSPTMVGLCWGIAATAGIGILFGVLLALVAHGGNEAPLPASQLLRPVARLLAMMALSALAAGVCGYFLAQGGAISIPAAFANVIPQERHNHFMAVWFAHGASYLVGLSGGGYLVLGIWRARGKPAVLPLIPRSPGAVVRTAVVVVVAVYVLWICLGRQ